MFESSEKKRPHSRESFYSSTKAIVLIGFTIVIYVFLTARIWLNYRETKQLVKENRVLRQQVARYTTTNEAPDASQGALYVKMVYGNQRQNLTEYKTLNQSGIEIVGNKSEDDNGLIIGNVESVEVGVVRGWACKKGNLDVNLQIYLFLDNYLVSIVNRSEEANPQAHDICLTTFQGKFLPNKKKVQQDYSTKIGFSYVLPDLSEAEHQVRAVAVPEGSKQGTELLNSPVAYLETGQTQSIKFVSDRKDRLLVTRNAQIVALNDQLKSKPWNAFEDTRIQINQTAKDSENATEYLAVIGVYVKGKHERDLLRNSWFPSTPKFKQNLEDKYKIIIRFLSPKGSVADDELEQYDDVIRINIKDDVQESLITKAYFTQIYFNYKSQFYFKMDPNTVLNIPQLISYLQTIKGQGNLYIGCFKSGQIYTNQNHRFFEREHTRFGNPTATGGMQYIKHALSNFYGMSKGVVEYLTMSSPVLHTYTFEDVTVGSWMIGLDVQYTPGDFCCESYQCIKRHKCVAIKEKLQATSYPGVYKSCVSENKLYKPKLESIVTGKGLIH